MTATDVARIAQGKTHMNRLSGCLAVLWLAGCASTPQLPQWQAAPLLAALPVDCGGSADTTTPTGAANIVPGGLGVVRSEGRLIVLVAARSCLWTIDAAAGRPEPLPTYGDGIAPTMVDGNTGGLAFSSMLSGSVRAIDPQGRLAFNVSGLRQPAGVRMLPGGAVLVAEHGSGRILRLGPTSEYRQRVLLEGLDGPFGLVILNATTGFVTEREGGRVKEFRLDNAETRVVGEGFAQPEGITLMADGRLAVVETGHSRVIALDRATGSIEVLTGELPVNPGTDGADPSAVADIAAAPDGALYLSSARQRSILKLTPPAGTVR